VKIDITPNGDSDALDDVAVTARQAEAGGVDGVAYPERSADAMQHVTLAASATTRTELMTRVVVAFARSPMTLATQAWSAQQLSRGRFILGLGSQVRAHVERRFSMPWGAPRARMADFVGALRAIWHSWQAGEPLDYRGEFYQHTLMTPMFTPSGRWPAPRVMLAVLGSATAGAADGVMIHPFITGTYLAQQIRPALDRGAAARNRSALDRFEISGSPFVATGQDEEALAASVAVLRSRLAFYGSTPAYRRLLDTHGWGDLGDRLHQLSTSSSAGKWVEMAALIPHEMLGHFAVIGEPAQAATTLAHRYGSLLDRCQVNVIGLSSLAERLEFARLIKDAVARDSTRPSAASAR